MLNKHWGSIQSPLKGDSEWTNISLDQFKNYISTIDNLSELRYIFNVKKITTEQAKEGMKAFLKANAESVFNTNPSLFKKLDKFDGSGKIEDWEDLYDLANSNIANNPIVSFVQSL